MFNQFLCSTDLLCRRSDCICREKKESGDTPVAENIVAEDKARKPDVKKESSYTSVVEGPFDSMMAQDKANKPDVMKRHLSFLNERYDLSQKTTTDVTMSGGKPLPVGPTARLKETLTWDTLAGMSPAQIKEKNVFPTFRYRTPIMRLAACFSHKSS